MSLLRDLTRQRFLENASPSVVASLRQSDDSSPRVSSEEEESARSNFEPDFARSSFDHELVRCELDNLAARLPPFPAKLSYVTPEILDSPPRAPRASPGPYSRQITPSRSPLRRVYSGPGSKPDYSSHVLHSLSPISPHDFSSPRPLSPTLHGSRTCPIIFRPVQLCYDLGPALTTCDQLLLVVEAYLYRVPGLSSRTYAQTSQSPHSTPSTWFPDTSATSSPRTPVGFTMGPSRQGLTQQVLLGTPRLPGPMALRMRPRSSSQPAGDSKSTILRAVLLPHPVRARRLSQPAVESTFLLSDPVPCPLLPCIKTPTPPSLNERFTTVQPLDCPHMY
jgi:hypothetical protein